MLFPENISHVSRQESLRVLNVKPSTLRQYQLIFNELQRLKKLKVHWEYDKNDKGFTVNSLKSLIYFRELIKKSSLKKAINQITK
jgi:hypothetical protein